MSVRTLKTLLIVSVLLNIGAVYVGIKGWEYRSHINHFLEKYTHVVREFSARELYLEANKALRSDTTITGRVVFMGTQVTQDWPLKESFPDLEPINRGVFGQRLAGFPLRFYSDVVNLRPEAVVVEISSFQFRPQYSTEEIAEWVAMMVDLAEAHRIVPIIPTVIPPRRGTTLEEAGDYRISDTVTAFNSWLRAELTRRDLPLCDFAKVMTDSSGGLMVDLSITAVDISDKGYAVMTRELGRVLTEHRIAD